MDATKISNFSIDRILGTEVGRSYTTGAESLQHCGCLSGIFLHGHSNPHNGNWKYGSQPQCTYLDQGGNQINRCRMRTVFTDSQTKQLEQLFEQTDYPGVEGRAELARNEGLTEESVRVWFKNRRARRKRTTKAKSPDFATPTQHA